MDGTLVQPDDEEVAAPNGLKVHPSGGVEGPVLWRRATKYVLWKAEEKWKA